MEQFLCIMIPSLIVDKPKTVTNRVIARNVAVLAFVAICAKVMISVSD